MTDMGWTHIAPCFLILILVADAFVGHIAGWAGVSVTGWERYNAKYADILPPIRTWVHPGLYVLTAIGTAWAYYAAGSIPQTVAIGLFLVAIAAGTYDYIASIWDRVRHATRTSVQVGKRDMTLVLAMTTLCSAAAPIVAAAVPADPNPAWYGLLTSINLLAMVMLFHVSAPIRYRG
jgi:hypothetical protein